MLSLAPRWNSRSGYTLIEMIIVTALVGVGSAVAIPVTLRMVANAKGDSQALLVTSFFETARNRAVAERRNMELVFTSDNTMEVERLEVPGPTRTVVATLQLSDDAEFLLEDDTLPDTPERFGGSLAINFTGAAPVMFTSDGSLIDSAGDVVNATIYMARPNNLETQRAITISGVTGLIRSYKWRGSVWQQ